jgi:hypothetical protein
VTLFLAFGVLGLGLLLVSILLGDVLDGAFDAIDLDVGGGGIFTGPTIGAFLATFGFGAALISYSTESSDLVASFGGLGTGVVGAGIVGAVTRTLMHMPTDAVPRSGDLLGQRGTVVTRIPEGGLGEVTMHLAGQMVKLNARAAEPIAAGIAVVVTDVTSATSVVVRRAEES